MLIVYPGNRSSPLEIPSAENAAPFAAPHSVKSRLTV